MTTFADTTYLVALMDDEDQWHPKALALLDWAEKRAPLHVHALTVGETIAIVGSHMGGKVARDAYVMLKDTTIIHLPTMEDLDASMDLVLKYDGTLSLSDALSLHLMRAQDGSEILSFDKDFDGKGVARVHEPPPPGRRRSR